MKQSPYPAYRDSGIPWLGQVPDHWNVIRIKYSTYVKARVGWQGLTTDEFIDEGPFLVTGTDFEKGVVNWHTCYHVDEERYSQDPYIMLKEGDLLITKDGTIGKIAIIKNMPDKATLNSGVFVTRPLKNCYLSKYLFWVLSSKAFIDFIDFIKTGTTINHLYQNDIVNFAFPIPTLAEQELIVTYLDHQTAKIDALIAKKQHLLELLVERRSTLISRAVTKGLDPEGEMKESGVPWLGQVPKHWEIVHLRRVIKKFVDYRGHTPPKVDNGIPLITARNIKNGKIDWELSQEYIPDDLYSEWMVRGLPESGDVLVTTEAPLGETAQITDTHIALAQRIVLLKADKIKVTNDFLKFFLASNAGQGELWSRATGSTAVGIKASHLKEIIILIPPIQEQVEISNTIQKEEQKIFILIAKVQSVIERLREHRSALISSVVTGKFQVTIMD